MTTEGFVGDGRCSVVVVDTDNDGCPPALRYWGSEDVGLSLTRKCSADWGTAYFDLDGEPLRLSSDGGLVRVWNFSDLHAALREVEERVGEEDPSESTSTLDSALPKSPSNLNSPLAKSVDQSTERNQNSVLVGSADVEWASAYTYYPGMEADVGFISSLPVSECSLPEDVSSLGKAERST